METFGERLKRIRETHDVSANALANMAGVDHANVYRIEGGKRDAPSMKVVFGLVMAIPNTDAATRKSLLDAAILERTSDEWYRYLIYEFVATADQDTINAVMSRARAALASDDAAARGVLQDNDMNSLLLQIADEDEFAGLRAQLAGYLAKRVAIVPEYAIVEVEPTITPDS